MFRFVQWEFPGRLGPGTGRYVLRPTPGEGPEQILVIAAAEAPAAGRRRLGGGRRARSAAPEPEPSPVPLTRATVVEAAPLAGAEAAGAWLARAGGDDSEATVQAALVALNLAVHAHRIAAADPDVAEVGAEQALVTRIGYGTGDQVADGRWTEARELAPPDRTRRERREAALRPQERLAALLGGRDAVLACEVLALRARQDLDRGRGREAAMQVHLALEAARVELPAWSSLTGMAERLGEIDARRDDAAAAANEALQGGLSAETLAAVAQALERIERALRARSAAGAY